jgi:hypothetical protein
MDAISPFVGPAMRIADFFRSVVQKRRRVRVLVHQGYFMYGYGASPLTEPPPEMMNLSPPVTGYGEKVYTRYYFMKVTNTSRDRDIVVTHAWFTGAPREMLLTRRPLYARLAYDDTWEGWLNAATLADARNVERSGRVVIAGKKKPFKSRLNKGVPPVGPVA